MVVRLGSTALVSYHARASLLVPSMLESCFAVFPLMPPPCLSETQRWVPSFPPKQRYLADTVATPPFACTWPAHATLGCLYVACCACTGPPTETVSRPAAAIAPRTT